MFVFKRGGASERGSEGASERVSEQASAAILALSDFAGKAVPKEQE